MTRRSLIIPIVALAASVPIAQAHPTASHHPTAPSATHAYGKFCLAAWTAKRGTAAFRAYFAPCVKAAAAATKTAKTTGNPTNTTADHTRGAAACAHQTAFAPPRNTLAKRTGFAACVRAAINAQQTLG